MSNGLTDVGRTVDPPPLDILEVTPDPLLKLLPPTRVVVVVSLTVDSRFLYWVGGWLYRLDEAGRASGRNVQGRGKLRTPGHGNGIQTVQTFVSGIFIRFSRPRIRNKHHKYTKVIQKFVVIKN
jgi:hypothetical protein